MKQSGLRRVFAAAATLVVCATASHAATNQDLAGNVQIELLTSEAIDGTTIFTRADGTTVILLGAVESDAEKRTAEQIARGVSGVSNVVNQLEVRPMGAEQPSVDADLATPEAAQHEAPAGGSIAPPPAGAGPGALHPGAPEPAEDASASGRSKPCVGARYRARLLGVAPAQAMPKIADEELRTRVSQALQHNPLLGGSKISVAHVHNGAVRLEGEAQSIPVHQQALVTALQVPGVCKVASDITSGGDASAQGATPPGAQPDVPTAVPVID